MQQIADWLEELGLGQYAQCFAEKMARAGVARGDPAAQGLGAHASRPAYRGRDATSSSIQYARRQQARSWELPSSKTLAELLIERGQRDAARQLLAPIYDWFIEGFDTLDLREAKALLGGLTT
jgi:predicted ATPase